MEQLGVVHVLIGERVYQTGRITADALIKTAKEKYTNERKNAIVAIEKGNKIEMRRDEFETEKEMKQQIRQLKANGFKAHFVKRW